MERVCKDLRHIQKAYTVGAEERRVLCLSPKSIRLLTLKKIRRRKLAKSRSERCIEEIMLVGLVRANKTSRSRNRRPLRLPTSGWGPLFFGSKYGLDRDYRGDILLAIHLTLLI
jgi:hypothetical protein